jgi:uncharacterized protein (TIGR03790 family)
MSAALQSAGLLSYPTAGTSGLSSALARDRIDRTNVRATVIWIRAAAAAASVAVGIAACRPATALTPDEVLVVANRTHPDSLALAKLYAERRAIPAQNVLHLATVTRDYASRRHYEARIRDPIRKALIDRKLTGRIKCIVLTWGVPIRVGPPKDAQADARASLKVLARRMHFRLAVDYKLLASVGRTFPAPRTQGLEPVGKLFASPAPALPKPLPAIRVLTREIERLLREKQAAVPTIREAGRRQIAARQLMGLYLDLHGLTGLIRHVRDRRPVGAPDANDLRKQLDEANRRIEQLRKARTDAPKLLELLALMEKAVGLVAAAPYAARFAAAMGDGSPLATASASVDSELALLWVNDYPLPGALANPLHWRSRRLPGRARPRVMMTSRIDGPTRADAARILASSLAAEKAGLDGVFYIDAGGPLRLPAPVRHRYDDHFRRLHRFVVGRTKMKAVLDEKIALFPPGSCPNAALYCGWYSLRKYVPAFRWLPGAVGWHVASFEAMHLRDPNSPEWCVQMIKGGVAATLGAVSEPLLTHFPVPEEFFALLLTGKYTVAECYWRTIPAASWQMILIADPLYDPFRARPQVKVEHLPPGLAP